MKKRFKNGKLINFISRYWVVLLAIVAGLGLIFGGIEFYKEEVLNIDPDIEYEEQNTLYFGCEEIKDFNPYNTKSEDMYYMSSLINTYLFRYDENMGILPQLVDTFDVNTKKASITLKLREDVYFSKGNQVTAKDVVNCINYIKRLGSTSPYYDNVRKIASAYVKGKDVNIFFYNNYNCSLDDLVIPIVNLENPKLGAGEFYISKVDKRKAIYLKPNKKYYLGESKKEIIFTILPERELSKGMMDIYEVTCYVDDSIDRKSSAINSNFKIYDFTSNNVDFIYFNVRRPLTSKKNFRQAISYAIDSEKILKDAYMDDGVLSDTIYYPNFLGVTDTLDSYEHSISKAKLKLSVLGYSDKDDDGILEDVYGNKQTLVILVNQTNNMRLQASKLIKKNLEETGFSVEIKTCDDNNYLSEIRRKDYDILITGYEIAPNYDLRFMFNGQNDWGFSDYNLQMKAAELDRIHSIEIYFEKYKELKEALIDEDVYYPLCYKNMSLIGVKTFETEKFPTFADIYKNIDSFSWKKILK